MTRSDWQTDEFARNRQHLHAVAYRMLGSATEAEDAVQEAWLRLSRSDTEVVANLGVTALFSTINAVDVKLPALRPQGVPLIAGVSPGLSFPASLPWGIR